MKPRRQKFPFRSLLGLTLAMAATSSLQAQTTPAPQPTICTRSCWGARNGTCTTTMSQLTRAIIHHTASAGDWTVTSLSGSAAQMRSHQNYHMDANGWCDLAYHFTVDKLGNIFEGRKNSMTTLIKGTHAGCGNNDSFGFTFLGYCHSPYNHNPPTAMRNAIYDVIAWRMPSGWSPYGNRTSYAGSMNGTAAPIDTHRWVGASGGSGCVYTSCPGDYVVQYITDNFFGGEMRSSVASRRGEVPPPKASSGSRIKGDFNGDGREDVLVLYDYGSKTSKLWMFRSTGTGFAVPVVWWASNPGSWDASLSQFVAADLNGDGKTDAAALFDYGDDTSKIWVWISTGSGFATPDLWWESNPGSWNAQLAKLMAGDFNGDGKTDVASAYDYGGSTTKVWVWPSTGSGFSTPVMWWSSTSWTMPNSRFLAGNFNGDAKTDLLGAYYYGTNTTKFWVSLSTGSTFGAASVWWTSTGWNMNQSTLMVGDFTGDGKSDMLGAFDYLTATTKYWVMTSSGAAFSSGTAWWSSSTGSWDAQKSKWVAGDFTGGGKADVAALYDYGSGTSKLWTWSSSGSTFNTPGLWWASDPGSFTWSKSTPF